MTPSRRGCHQSADLPSRELAIWPVSARNDVSASFTSGTSLAVLSTVSLIPVVLAELHPFSSMERISSSTCRALHLEGKSSAHYSQCTARDDLPSLIPSVRGALLEKGPDSSLGELHGGSCSGNIHMEEEVNVPEAEVEDGRDK